ncbi:Uncharacterised protein [Bordetella pertussis]|nr:Uncharacterised protein [Bordetella pertussis]
MQHRIQVAGVVEIRAGEQLLDAARAAAPLAALAIVGHAPAGIPGHAEAGHGLVQHQGFEPHLRTDHIDPVHLFQQGQGIHVVAQRHRIGVVGNPRQIADLSPAATSGCVLTQISAPGLSARAAASMASKVGRLGATQGHAHVAFGLVHHQHPAPAVGRHAGGQEAALVVLRQAAFAHQLHGFGHGVLDAVEQRARRRQQALQLGFARRVVVDAQAIDHQRQRRKMAPGAERAQETVFQRNVGHAQRTGAAPRRRGAGRAPHPATARGAAPPGGQKRR